jgi:hypothetical protein
VERAGRTVAFPGAYISITGAIFLILGASLPAWSVYYRTRANAGDIDASIKIVGGALRPTMLLLPRTLNGKRFEIADRQVTFGQFLRVTGHVSRDAVRVMGRSSQTCPAFVTLDTYETAILCVTPLEATAYANALTTIENGTRRLSGEVLMTLCYGGQGLQVADPSCTGYRLPTVEEWRYAAASGSPVKDTGATPPAAVVGSADATCPSSAWFIYGMCETAEIAIAGGYDSATPMVLGGSGGKAPSPLPSLEARTAIGFRLVRVPTEADPL